MKKASSRGSARNALDRPARCPAKQPPPAASLVALVQKKSRVQERRVEREKIHHYYVKYCCLPTDVFLAVGAFDGIAARSRRRRSLRPSNVQNGQPIRILSTLA
jgi:hypothetical protein